jgi:hypothetical protein
VVADAAVFGIPNEEMGEEVKTIVQPPDIADAGSELSADSATSTAMERTASLHGRGNTIVAAAGGRSGRDR